MRRLALVQSRRDFRKKLKRHLASGAWEIGRLAAQSPKPRLLHYAPEITLKPEINRISYQ